MKTGNYYGLLIVVIALGGCASYPRGPSVMVLPGTSANFDQFRADQSSCDTYAAHEFGASSPAHAAHASALDSAATATLIGAAAGALIGAASGDAGVGAAIGAGGGLLVGSAGASEAHAVTGSRAQANYDNAYIQCMYARGHQVPVPASVAASQAAAVSRPSAGPPPGAVGPPVVALHPPPGTAPPPGY